MKDMTQMPNWVVPLHRLCDGRRWYCIILEKTATLQWIAIYNGWSLLFVKPVQLDSEYCDILPYGVSQWQWRCTQLVLHPVNCLYMACLHFKHLTVQWYMFSDHERFARKCTSSYHGSRYVIWPWSSWRNLNVHHLTVNQCTSSYCELRHITLNQLASCCRDSV